MNTIHWHMNVTQGGANLRPGVNLLPGMQIVHMNTAIARIKNMRTACLVFNQNMVDSYQDTAVVQASDSLTALTRSFK